MKFLLTLTSLFMAALICGCSAGNEYKVKNNEALYIAIGSKCFNFDTLQKGKDGALEVGGEKWGELELFVDGKLVEVVDEGFFIGPLLNQSLKKGKKVLLKGKTDEVLYFGIQLIKYKKNIPMSSKILMLGTIKKGKIHEVIKLDTL